MDAPGGPLGLSMPLKLFLQSSLPQDVVLILEPGTHAEPLLLLSAPMRYHFSEILVDNGRVVLLAGVVRRFKRL